MTLTQKLRVMWKILWGKGVHRMGMCETVDAKEGRMVVKYDKLRLSFISCVVGTDVKHVQVYEKSLIFGVKI